ncbi:unnamed protein product [Symbiodinium microadriaticum]|nr:unnamed protein product [Symbiodinium microadriaticum]
MLLCWISTCAAGPLSNLLSGMVENACNATGSGDVHTAATSFSAFFPDTSSHETSHFLPTIASEHVHSHSTETAHIEEPLDAGSLLLNRRPRTFYSFCKK